MGEWESGRVGECESECESKSERVSEDASGPSSTTLHDATQVKLGVGLLESRVQGSGFSVQGLWLMV